MGNYTSLLAQVSDLIQLLPEAQQLPFGWRWGFSFSWALPHRLLRESSSPYMEWLMALEGNATSPSSAQLNFPHLAAWACWECHQTEIIRARQHPVALQEYGFHVGLQAMAHVGPHPSCEHCCALGLSPGLCSVRHLATASIRVQLRCREKSKYILLVEVSCAVWFW